VSRMSKRAIAALTSDEATEPLDERPQALAQVTTVSGELLDTIQERACKAVGGWFRSGSIPGSRGSRGRCRNWYGG
jgi:hypothetical protein